MLCQNVSIGSLEFSVTKQFGHVFTSLIVPPPLGRICILVKSLASLIYFAFLCAVSYKFIYEDSAPFIIQSWLSLVILPMTISFDGL